MKNICFFNHFHNGDIFHSKEFVRQVTEVIDTQFFYYHLNDSNLLLDVNVSHKNILDLPSEVGDRVKFLDTEDTVYVNTWIGSYFHQGVRYSPESTDSECTLRFSYAMYSLIYEELNKIFGCDLKLKPITEYIPSIDYSKFNISNIDQYVNTNIEKRVLFSNGPCLSGQCSYYGDMKDTIETLASKYPQVSFISTSPIESKLPNIKSTKDIIGIEGCDLNEIGYLSTFCDIIVGRNSGPFCFCTNKDNVNNLNTSFYVFGDNAFTSFLYDIEIDCQFVFEFFNGLENVTSSIDSLIADIV
jgi:hypothetical protein